MKQLHNGLGEPRPTLFLLLLLIETCLFIQTNVANPPISCFSFDPFFLGVATGSRRRRSGSRKLWRPLRTMSQVEGKTMENPTERKHLLLQVGSKDVRAPYSESFFTKIHPILLPHMGDLRVGIRCCWCCGTTPPLSSVHQ